MEKKFEKINRRTDGMKLWKMIEKGPKGGGKVWYARRDARNEESLHGMELWCETQREVQ